MAHTTALLAPAKATELAASLQADDDEGWTYTAVHDPKGTGYSFVEIRDEAGKLVGTL